MNKNQTNANEPYFFIALVIKGTEKHYLDLLNYMKTCNGSKIVYQCKSLTYLHVTRDDGVKVEVETPELMVESAQRGRA
jgi:hypothetical protein